MTLGELKAALDNLPEGLSLDSVVHIAGTNEVASKVTCHRLFSNVWIHTEEGE